MSIEKIFKKFDEKFTIYIDERNGQERNGLLWPDESDRIKDFIKESIKQALDEITPERREMLSNREMGWNMAISKLEGNKAKFLDN